LKLRSLIAAGLTTACLTLPSAALTLKVDGLDCTTQAKAVAVNGQTYVSLRSVAGMLNPDAHIAWSDGAASVTAPGLTLTARPGDPYIQVNGESVYMEHGVQAVDGSVMVALRPLAAAMGASVTWDGAITTASLTSGTGVPSTDLVAGGYSEQDLYWLSRIISAESRGEPFKGKLAVGTVVLNRVASPDFPNTVYDVIFDSRWGGQFTPVRNGTIYKEPTQESVQAARLCLQGAREAGDSLYFLNPDLAANHWAMSNRPFVAVIGSHYFYR